MSTVCYSNCDTTVYGLTSSRYSYKHPSDVYEKTGEESEETKARRRRLAVEEMIIVALYKICTVGLLLAFAVFMPGIIPILVIIILHSGKRNEAKRDL